uniref:Nuclease harbi1 n=1 Tax=Triatoma infestans TaxID=30076 RepID=A0A170VYI9_TRIIF
MRPLQQVPPKKHHFSHFCWHIILNLHPTKVFEDDNLL